MVHDVQILVSASVASGTLQHALTLSQVCTRLGHKVTLTDIQPGAIGGQPASTPYDRLSYLRTSVAGISPASFNIVVGLWDEHTIAAARFLSQTGTRLILAPTVYRDSGRFPELPGGAEALWYLSWDQAVSDRDSWRAAERVEIVRCAVDTEMFRRPPDRPAGPPWVLGRHSRDVAAKFAPHTAEFIRRVGEVHDIKVRMLGAAHVMNGLESPQAEIFGEYEIPPVEFLAGCHVWVYAHAPYWRETACLAMLEAMASGLPVVVGNTGGMREYVQHGRTGFLANDVDDFVSYTSLLLDMPHLRYAMAERARAFIQEFCSIEAMAECIRPIIEDGPARQATALGCPR